jgi:hypothetical protein
VDRAEAPKDFLSALRALSGFLEREKVPHVIIGGVAVALVGRPRTTQDIDAIVLLGDRPLEAFLEAAHAAGFDTRIPDAAAFARQFRVVLLRHRKSKVGVDLSVGALPFEEAAVQRARRILVEDRRIPVATPEDLIIMKMVASRSRDIADIEGVIAANPKLDRRRVRSVVRQFSEVLEMPEMLERLEALLGKRRRR